MKKNIKRLILLTLIIITLVFSSMFIFAENEVVIKLNGKQVNFTNIKPYRDSNTGEVLVPARFVAEELGALVEWNTITNQVEIIKDDKHIKFKQGESSCQLNNKEKLISTKIAIKKDTAFVPLGFICQNLNIHVGWDEETGIVLLSQRNNIKEFVIQDIYLGQIEEQLIAKLGEPNRKDLSEYGFHWYIYNQDYSKYIQVGVKDKKVVAIYTNADNWKSATGISIGTPRANVEKLLGQPLEGIIKGNINYKVPKADEKSIYLIDDSYITVYYDLHEGNTVTSIEIIDEKIELGLEGYYGPYSEELRNAFEKQMLDLTNSIRFRKGLNTLVWSERAKVSSRKHSIDMANNDFFDHNNLKGESPFDRMKKEGITCQAASENIAAGIPNAIGSHEALLNSIGHRKNTLGEFKRLGVGVSYNANRQYKYYYTQNFFISG